MPNWPSDVDPESGFRLPRPRREDLDEAGRRAYDRIMAPGASLAGLHGPSGIHLYSKTAEHLTALNWSLRYETGLSGRVREIAILATAREMDSQFEWSAHEAVALKEGVDAALVEAIRLRQPVSAFAEQDALIVELCREMLGDRKVRSTTFARAKAAFGEQKLVEIAILITNYMGTAALLCAFDMQLHPGKEPRLP
jgi:4-carboxymuconolactone decarboxylase